MDGGEEIALGFVVTSGDGPKLLEPGEEVLDQMACLEQVPIIVAADLPVCLWWDHGDLAGRAEWFDNACLGVERLVSGSTRQSTFSCTEPLLGHQAVTGSGW